MWTRNVQASIILVYNLFVGMQTCYYDMLYIM